MSFHFLVQGRHFSLGDLFPAFKRTERKVRMSILYLPFLKQLLIFNHQHVTWARFGAAFPGPLPALPLSMAFTGDQHQSAEEREARWCSLALFSKTFSQDPYHLSLFNLLQFRGHQIPFQGGGIHPRTLLINSTIT